MYHITRVGVQKSVTDYLNGPQISYSTLSCHRLTMKRRAEHWFRSIRCQFHQRLTRPFFVRKCFAQLFSSYVLTFEFLAPKFCTKNVRKMRKTLMNLTAVRLRLRCVMVTQSCQIKTKIESYQNFNIIKYISGKYCQKLKLWCSILNC